jgi:uncharacterized protein YgiM (DUF1202 family)
MTAIAALLLFAFTVVPSFAQANGKARFVHVVPGVGAVDIYINQQLAVEMLPYGGASLLLNLPEGTHTVTVTPANNSTTVWTQEITIAASRPTTFIASEPTAFTPVVLSQNELPFGAARLLLYHGLAGGPAVNVVLAEAVSLGGQEQPAGTPIATEMAYGSSFGSFDVPTQQYLVDVVTADDETVVLDDLTLPLATSTAYLAIVYGTTAQPEALLLSAPTQPGTETGLVRFAHAVVGGPAVDIYAGSTLIVPSLAAEQASEHIALPAEEHTIAIHTAGTEDVLAQADITVAQGSAQTIIAMETVGAVVIANYADDISSVLSDSSAAAISVVNAIAESTLEEVTVGGDTVAEDLDFAFASEASPVVPTIGELAFTLTLGGQTGSVPSGTVYLYGGTYYNAIAVRGDVFNSPRLLLFPTTISTGLGSAPNGQMMLAMPMETPLTPIAAVTLPPPADLLATAAATPAPVVAANTNVITGRVLLDPGANLQLRQFPNADALSLGLAPSGTVLVVNGREGAPVALVEGQAPPPEAADWVDPVGLLPDERTDLDPTQTWLRVTYNTPDGGTITAWVNAQFLDVRDGRNERALLRNLEPIGGNIPGAASQTLVTPPPVPTDTLTAQVYNLNPGVSLNIRRFPSVDAEVIGRVPNGTVLVFVGMEETDQWAFVEYTTPEGGIVRGWVTVQYIQYTYNGRVYTLEDFKNVVSRTTSQALFEVIPADTVGTISGPAAEITLPTVDPLKDQFVATVRLDPGANLQLRRNPDPTSESLNLIPTNTQLIVSVRTEAGDWLKVTFEGDEGWISSSFVTITFNGVSASVVEIPVDTDVAP